MSLTAAGTDFRSDKLWDMYILWEKENRGVKAVVDLYDRLLAIPTQMYKNHFDNFKQHVQTNNPKDLLTLDDFLKYRQEVVVKKKLIDLHPEEVEVPISNDAPPGVDAPPGIDAPPGTELETTDTGMEETELDALRQKIIDLRQSVHDLNEQEVSKRWAYEEAIRRPYFHVKPLEKTQLQNWRDYLDFEIENGTHERTVVLFERCLIACALYDEFWMKYTTYLEKHSIEAVRTVYRRVCTCHLPKKPGVHLAFAAFEEKQGNLNEASQILERFEEVVPGLVMVALRRISLERRRGNFTIVENLYAEYVDKAENLETKTFFRIKLARYKSKVLGNVTDAKAILEHALSEHKGSVKLYLQLIDLEYQQPQLSESVIVELFNKAITGPLLIEHRVAFSQRKLELLEDFSADIGKIQEAYDNHQNLLKELQSSRKRKADDKGDESDEKSAEKKTKTDGNSYDQSYNGYDQSAYAATPATTTADQTAAYGYGQQQWGNYNAGYGYNQGWGGYGMGYYGAQ